MRNEEGKEIWEGYCIDFIKKLSEEMQFDYDLVVPEDKEFGKKLPNGEWNGLIGDLAKGVGSKIFISFTCPVWVCVVKIYRPISQSGLRLPI